MSSQLTSNLEPEILAILEAFRIFSSAFQYRLIMESNSMNAISWVNSMNPSHWKILFYLNEIKALASSVQANFVMWGGK